MIHITSVTTISGFEMVCDSHIVFSVTIIRGSNTGLINIISSLYTKLLKLNTPINPQKEVLVTDGAYEALFCAVMGNVNQGDEVIIIEPYFDCYEPMVRLAGGTPRFISLSPTVSNSRTVTCFGKCLESFLL